jgi:peptidoglycan/xylan/chitin deacetylase (PgdA/CDA1 family)
MRVHGPSRTVASHVLATVPHSLLGAVAGIGLIVPYYHLVSDAEVRHVRHLYPYKSIRKFEADLEFVMKRYTPIALSDLLDHLKHGRRLPPKSALLTFDDGFREMSDTVAPILRAKGVAATFFVSTAFIDNHEMCYLNKASLLIDEIGRRGSCSVNERVQQALRSQGLPSGSPTTAILSIAFRQRHVIDELAEVINLDIQSYVTRQQPYLTSDQIRTLIRDGFAIGAHSVNHPLYADLPLAEQLHQTLESVKSIRQTFGLSYGAFAFPHSDRQVSQQYFERVAESGVLDVSFGTSGMVTDSIPNHFQRFSLEAPRQPARRIIAFHLARRFAKRMRGTSTIQRESHLAAAASPIKGTPTECL